MEEAPVLNPKLCNSDFPFKLIFQNAGTEFLLLPSLILFQPLLLELHPALPRVVARSQSTAPTRHTAGVTAPAFTCCCTGVAGEFLCSCSTIRFQTSLLRSCPQVTSGKLSYALNSGSGTNPTFQLERRTMRQELSLAPGSKVKGLIY